MIKKITMKFDKFFRLVKKAIHFAWHRHHFLIPPKAMKKYIKSFFIVLKRGGNSANLFVNQKAYLKWLEEQDKEFDHKTFKYNPKISVVIPTYNVSRKLLSECLDSILNQTYTNFEICIADDNSPNEETKETLRDYMEKDDRIKVIFREKNGMISEATNTALTLATGEFIMLVDNDDIVYKDAMYYMVEALNENKKLDFIYSDEDKLDFNGKRMEPNFKPDYSPDTFMAVNYICHLTMIRKTLIDKVGGFRKEYDGSQDYDLFLRVLEHTSNVHHIDKILYSWRLSPTSTAAYIGNKEYIKDAAINALEDALKRRKIKGRVYHNPKVSTYLIDYKHDNPLVSIIIPTKNYGDIVKKCVDSIYEKCTYKNYEIILVDNRSDDPKSIELFKKYEKEHDNFKIVKADCEFNYSKINNLAVKESKGEYVLLLNNDTEVIDGTFLDKMVGYASQKHVGAVGIKLLYPDNKVQHAGVVLGYGGVAGHVYVTADRDDCGLMGRLTMPYNYSAVTAACLLVARKKYDEVKGLDENLTVALNDVDFNLKLMDKGYYNVQLSHIEMYHHESKSRGYEVTKEKTERFEREQNYMVKKWGKTLERDKFFSVNNF